MSEYRVYRRKGHTAMRPYVQGEDMSDVSVSETDAADGHPREGDMIAMRLSDETDKWLVAKRYFEDNYEPI